MNIIIVVVVVVIVIIITIIIAIISFVLNLNAENGKYGLYVRCIYFSIGWGCGVHI